MKTTSPTTSPYTPDLGQVRAWLEKMIAGLKFLELVTAVLALVGRMCALNAELTNQLALAPWSAALGDPGTDRGAARPAARGAGRGGAAAEEG